MPVTASDRPTRPGRARRRAVARLVAVTSLVAVGLGVGSAPSAGAGGGGGGAVCSGFAEGDTIDLYDSCIEGTAHFTEARQLTVHNRGGLMHDLTAIDGSFSTGPIAPGASASVTLGPDSGPIAVYCTMHADRRGQGMAGVILAGTPLSAATGATVRDGQDAAGAARAEAGGSSGSGTPWWLLGVGAGVVLAGAGALALGLVTRVNASLRPTHH